MQLSDKHIEKYRELMKSNFNKDLSIGEARDGLRSLALMVKGAYRPMSNKELAMLMRNELEYGNPFLVYLAIVLPEEEPEWLKEEEFWKDSD